MTTSRSSPWDSGRCTISHIMHPLIAGVVFCCRCSVTTSESERLLRKPVDLLCSVDSLFGHLRVAHHLTDLTPAVHTHNGRVVGGNALAAPPRLSPQPALRRQSVTSLIHGIGRATAMQAAMNSPTPID